MWEHLGTYDQIFRAALIGFEFAIPVGIGYYLMNRRTSKTIEHLKELLRRKNGG